MSEPIYGIFLWLVVAWPLLLAIPSLHTRLPWPCHVAILPAAVLIMLPGEATHILHWFVFGTGLAVNGETRWVLAMTVIIWFMAANIMKSPTRDPAHGGATTFFLLTLAGNLGTVLSMDLVGFFSFSALMGYGFYGLLVQGNNEAARRAGRLYLIFMIVGDLILFEALLLAASATESLHFDAVHQAIAVSATSPTYLSMVLIGFTLKTGAWPAHVWLMACFNAASRLGVLLLSGVPVAIGLLGLVRWLPLGESVFDVLGTVVLVMSVAAILHATLRFFTGIPAKTLPAWQPWGCSMRL